MSSANGQLIAYEYKWKIDETDNKIGKYISNPVPCLNNRNFLQFAATVVTYSGQTCLTPELVLMDLNLHCIQVKSVYCFVSKFDDSAYYPLELKSGKKWNLYFSASSNTRIRVYGRQLELNYKILIESCVDKFAFGLVDNNMAKEFWAAALNGSKTDVEFQIGQSVISAHRVIVAARSPILAKYLVDNPTEKRIVIQNAEVDPETFRSLLQFLYTGQLKTVPTPQLMTLAQKYQVETLKTICSDAFNFSKLEEFGSFTAIPFRNSLVKKNVGTAGLLKKSVVLLSSSPRIKSIQINQQKYASVLISEGIRTLPHAYCKDYDVLLTNLRLMKTEWHLKWATVFSSAQPKVTRSNLLIEFDELSDENWSHQLIDGSLAAQLWSTVESKTGTDVQFHLLEEDRVFAAHRWILSARSPVFSAMFSSKMKEEQTGRVDIVDIRGDIFEEFLYFVYTGQLLKDGRYRSTAELLTVADKYQVGTLKSVCQDLSAPSPSDDDLVEMCRLPFQQF